MKKQFLVLVLILISFGSFAQTSGATTSDGAIDPLDNYIDPATNIDYKTELSRLNGDQTEVLMERCIMFTIQNEMGQSGEDSMSPSEIESYENLTATKCKCIQDGFTWSKESNVKGQCDNGTPAEKDLLLYTMDQCVDRLKLSDDSCKASMTDSCVNDFRYQCYQYMTQPHEFSEKSNPILNKCDYDDQTKNIKLECRSYCYIRNECDVTQEDFKNRKIGNVYLLKKKSRSSCVKGSTYGINDDNTIWVTNSCHGDFAIQYKDPKCGFRPTCTPKPHATDYIAESGTEDVEVVCNGEENESGGKQFCKVTPFKLDESGKLTDEPDPMKEVTYVKDLQLIQKIGPAKCNPGGNASAIDYNPRNKGLDGGWGIETQNFCHGLFKVSVKWQRKMCTMAGQTTSSRDTCCNGLYYDPTDKTCNVPAFDPPALDDEVKLSSMAESIRSGQQCNPKIDDEINAMMDKYFFELGNYENLFTLVDGKSDAISSIEVVTEESEESSSSSVIEPRPSTYDLTKLLHDTVVRYRTDYKKAYDEFKTAEDYTAQEYKAYISYLDMVNKKTNTPENDTAVEKNMFLGLDVQSAAFKNQKLTKSFQIAYIKTVRDMIEVYESELAKASHAGQNAVWYCAHNENCSENNWLVRDIKKDEVIDFLHDPAYPYKVLTIRGKMLPKLAKVNKLLLEDTTYSKFESNGDDKGLDKLGVYSKYFDYRSSEALTNSFVKRFEAAGLAGVDSTDTSSQEYYMTLDLFRKYSHEVPLRENSLIPDSDYLAASKEGSLAGGLPQYCEKQDDYEVRVPIGKAIEPLRMLQITGVAKAYFDLVSSIYEKNEGCLVDLNAEHDKNVAELDVNLGLDSRLIGNNNPAVNTATGSDAGFIKNVSGSLLGAMSSKYGTASAGSFMENLFGSSSSGASLSDSTSGGDLSALKKSEADRVSKLISKRIKYKKDNALAAYQDSLDSAFGGELKKKARVFASLSPSLSGKSGIDSASSANSALGSSSRDEDKKVGSDAAIDWGTNSGSSSSSYRSGSNRGSSRSGSGSGSSYGSGSSQSYGSLDNDKILDNIDDEKYEPNDSDSLFDRVTKRYIKSAYPQLLQKKKQE